MLIAACALLVPAAVLMALVVVGWPLLLTLDTTVARTLHGLALDHPGWTHAMRILTDWVWDTVTMRALLAAAVLWLWWRRQVLLGCWLAVTTAVAAGVEQGLKALIGRQRPHWAHPVDSAHHAAMPSGHAMTAAVVCALLLWALWLTGARRLVRGVAVAVAALSVAGVSFTRIYLGVHWLTDVVAGALLGAGLAACAAVAWTAWQRRERISG
jgi:membrane-associated phospholipid phosphatase